MKNTGKAFEKAIIQQCKIYESQGKALIYKVDPPTTTFFNKKVGAKQSILLPNPFPDFIGCYSNGNMIALELKDFNRPRLPINVKSGGVTESQVKAMNAWYSYNAHTYLLWYREGVVKMSIWNAITWEIEAEREKSLPWDWDCWYTVKGYDFLEIIEKVL